MSKKSIKVGDWVRFMRAGLLVIGEVRYVGKRDSLGELQFVTDRGEVGEHEILELRPS